MSPSRIIGFVFGGFLALIGTALVLGGLAAAFGFAVAGRDADGYLRSPAYDLATTGYALATEGIDIAPDPSDWVPDRFARIRLEVTSHGTTPVFVGIGPSESLSVYLAGVPHDEVARLGDRTDAVVLDPVAGERAPTRPGDETFWAASSTSTSVQTLNWDVARGSWSIALVNADASPGLDVTVRVAVAIPFLVGIGIGLMIAGLLAGALGTALIAGALRNGAGTTGLVAAGTPVGMPAHSAYPVIVEGRLEPGLNRWLWLVKWLLAIPHYVILVFLWISFLFLSAVAFFSILVTGRYPRPVFEFNVGVLRWTWRVGFYAFSAIGTDRYPPFTIDDDASYPARLDVAYPEHLSRGLVLVKWWLLAIPHYIIVGLFTNGLVWWATNLRGDGVLEAGGGLIGLLAFLAGVVLLVTGRYPQQLFDVIIGLNHWVYRVAAYAALMRDEYPPFRLDIGGTEPEAEPGPRPLEPVRPAAG